MRVGWLVLISLLTGCASVAPRPGILELPKSQRSPLEQQLLDLPPVDAPIMTVAVYGFADKTGQLNKRTTINIPNTRNVSR